MREKKSIYEYDEIKAVVDFMRLARPISSISEAAGVSTIQTTTLKLLDENHNISLQTGQIVNINNVNYAVIDTGENSFDIVASNLVATEWNLAVNFLMGSRIEINQVLNNLANDPSSNLIRFPLIWLFINNDRNHNPNDLVAFQTTLQFAFVHLTEKTYRANERLTYVFKTVLEPLFRLFTMTINSTYFQDKFYFEDNRPEFETFYRYFYGSSDQNLQVLDAPTDAIEVNFELSFINQYC